MQGDGRGMHAVFIWSASVFGGNSHVQGEERSSLRAAARTYFSCNSWRGWARATALQKGDAGGGGSCLPLCLALCPQPFLVLQSSYGHGFTLVVLSIVSFLNALPSSFSASPLAASVKPRWGGKRHWQVVLWLLMLPLPYVHSLLTSSTLISSLLMRKYPHALAVSVVSIWTFSVSFWHLDAWPGY